MYIRPMLKYLINRFKQRPAESLVEVILALFVVSVGAGAATVLIVSSIRANSFSKDNLVALNLAVEGVEAIRNIRDTNWVKFAYDKENCWYMKPEMGSTNSCTNAGNKIADGYYTIDLNPENYSWGLNMVPSGSKLDLSTNSTANDDYRLHFLDINNTDGLDDHDIYVSENTHTSALPPVTPGEESKFYRMVTVEMNDPAKNDAMTVTSLVQWRDGSAVHKVQFSSTLTNYNRF